MATISLVFGFLNLDLCETLALFKFFIFPHFTHIGRLNKSGQMCQLTRKFVIENMESSLNPFEHGTRTVVDVRNWPDQKFEIQFKI